MLAGKTIIGNATLPIGCPGLCDFVGEKTLLSTLAFYTGD